MTNLVGIHDREGKDIAPGWCLVTEEIGLDNDRGGDYRDIVSPIVRLNHRYNPQGTIPAPEHYEQFAETCARYVANSLGCLHWIIGNEPNLRHEWPDGRMITPEDYARCFTLCRDAIQRIRPHMNVIPAPIGPWNVEAGDWIEYWTRVLNNVDCDGLAVHSYGTLDHAFMGPPYTHRRYGFWSFQDFMAAIPTSKRSLPVYLTECNPNEPWKPGWIAGAVEEVRTWNLTGQRIHCVLPYCYINRDAYGFADKPDVIRDIEGVYEKGYTVTERWPCWDAAGFVEYIERLPWAVKPNKVFLHHTWKPTKKDWRGTYTMDAMHRVYLGYGWTVFPHLFVAEDGIWQMWDVRLNGAGVVGQNDGSIHIEMVGNYDLERPNGQTWENTVAVLGILLETLGLDTNRLFFHRDFAEKTCPGSYVTKEWVYPQVDAWRRNYRTSGLPEGEPSTVPAVIAEKARWWLEETQRKTEQGEIDMAIRLNKSLIVLLYRLENMLKGNE